MRFQFTVRETLLMVTVVALGLWLFLSQSDISRHRHRLPYSSNGAAFIKVIAADDFTPVANVQVNLTWVGRGADGGGMNAKTDANGIAHFTWGVGKGPTQVYLTPPPGSRFVATQFTTAETMLTGQADGTYYPSTFRIAVGTTTDPNFQDHTRPP